VNEFTNNKSRQDKNKKDSTRMGRAAEIEIAIKAKEDIMNRVGNVCSLGIAASGLLRARNLQFLKIGGTHLHRVLMT
jgi:hypothetical protein